MLSFSLLGDVGALPLVNTNLINQIDTTSITQLIPGACTADGRYIWNGTGWQAIRVGDQCTATSTITAPTDHGPQGGVTVTDPAGAAVPAMVTVPGASLNSGSARMVEVGPFRFPAELPYSYTTYWGKKLPADAQEWIKRVVSVNPGDGESFSQYLGAWFDGPNTTGRFDPSYTFYGMSASTLRDIKNWDYTWKPVARSTHPDNGKDYGIFLAVVYPDADANKPWEQRRLYLAVVWREIAQHWYASVWNWIENLVSKIVAYVCDKLTDPGMAATVAAGAAAGGPITIGVATGATLLCQPKASVPDAPADTQPAIKPKPPIWIYILGGLGVVGFAAYLLVPPKHKAA